jgi:hypothetical protein
MMPSAVRLRATANREMAEAAQIVLIRRCSFTPPHWGQRSTPCKGSTLYWKAQTGHCVHLKQGGAFFLFSALS